MSWLLTPVAAQPAVRPVRVKAKPVTLATAGLSGIQTPTRVRLAIGIDAAGNVTDVLPVNATHRRVATAAVAQARTWTYEPASIGGRPYPSVTYVAVAVRADGLVAVPDGGQAGANGAGGSPEAVSLSELDAPLRAVSRVPPRYPEELQRGGVGGTVSVRFLVDQTGRVRLPHVVAADAPELAPLALAALESWRFDPPRRHGLPVVISAQQAFVFTPTP